MHFQARLNSAPGRRRACQSNSPVGINVRRSYVLLRLRCSGSNFKKVNLDRVRRREKRNVQLRYRAGFETGVMQSCDRVIEMVAEVSDVGGVAAVFVPERKKPEKIAGGGQAVFLEHFRAARTDASCVRATHR